MKQSLITVVVAVTGEQRYLDTVFPSSLLTGKGESGSCSLSMEGRDAARSPSLQVMVGVWQEILEGPGVRLGWG